jgi:PHD/YefM family antitoxin component YafN of YafNO toxin-antitoxin module
MLKLVTAQELRDRLGEHLDRAHFSGEGFVVTRGQRPKAVILGPIEYLDLLDKLAAYERGRKPSPPANYPVPGLITADDLKRLLE